MVLPLHAQLIGADLHRPFHFEGGDPGAVGAGAFWLDTTVTPHRLWRRNGSNTAWVAVAPGDPEAIRDEIGAALVAGPGVAVSVNDPGDTITVAVAELDIAHPQATATAATNATTTYATWATTSRVLAAGTWAAAVSFVGIYFPSVTAQIETRVGAPFVGADLLHALQSANTRVSAVAGGEGTFTSDGTTATVFRVEYRRGAAAVTINAEQSVLTARCRRVGA